MTRVLRLPSLWLALFGTLSILWAWRDSTHYRRWAGWNKGDLIANVYQDFGAVGLGWVTERGKSRPYEPLAQTWKLTDREKDAGGSSWILRGPARFNRTELPKHGMVGVDIVVAHWALLATWVALSGAFVVIRIRRLQKAQHLVD